MVHPVQTKAIVQPAKAASMRMASRDYAQPLASIAKPTDCTNQ